MYQVLTYKHAVSVNFIQTGYATHLHGIFQFTTDLFYIRVDTFFFTTIYSSYKRSGNNNSISTKGKSFEYISTTADTAVYQNLHGIADCICNSFQNFSCCRALIQYATAMVGYDDCICTGFFSFECTFNGHYAFYNEWSTGKLNNLAEFFDSFASGRWVKILQEWKTCGIDIHCYGKCF